MSSSMGLCSIEKLDNDNYSVWSVQMKSVLIHTDLWSVVSGTLEIKPTDTAEEKAAFNVKNDKALASIFLCIKPSQINNIKNCTSAAVAWNTLKSIHVPNGPARRITLFKKLLYLKMSESACVKEHVNKFYDLAEQVNEIGVGVPEEVLTIILLSSLDKNFENFVVAMEARDTLPSLSTLKIKILEEGDRRQQNGEVSEKEQLFMSQGKNLEKTKNNKAAPNTNSSRRSYIQNVKCYNCGRRGHYAANCHNKGERNGNEKKSFTMLASAHSLIHRNLNKNTWCIDSGATAHMCCNKSLYTSYKEYKQKIILAGDNMIESNGIGTIELQTENCVIELLNVLYVENLQSNFISVAKVLEKGNKVTFEKEAAYVKDNKNNIIMKATKCFDLFIVYNLSPVCFTINTNNKYIVKWHERFGHLYMNSLKEMATKNLVFGLNSKVFNKDWNEHDCEICAKSKICEKKFPKISLNRKKEVLELVHTDVCGPVNKCSAGGAKYFVTFIDDMSRYIHIYLIKSKDEVFQKFKDFVALAEKQAGKKLKAIRSDNGREYLSKDFDEFLKTNGIQRQLTTPYSPQQNGVAERANRTLVEMARCMLLQSGLAEHFWGEAIQTAVYLRNRSETKAVYGKTPYEAWTSKKPFVSHFQTFGAKAIVLDNNNKKVQTKRC